MGGQRKHFLLQNVMGKCNKDAYENAVMAHASYEHALEFARNWADDEIILRGSTRGIPELVWDAMRRQVPGITLKELRDSEHKLSLAASGYQDTWKNSGIRLSDSEQEALERRATGEFGEFRMYMTPEEIVKSEADLAEHGISLS